MGCHSVGVTAAEELGLEVKQVCWLAGFEGDSFAFKSEVRVCRRPSQVQLMRGEFLEMAPYWAGVVSVRLGAIAEKKVSQHSCVWSSV